jgi:hypothetical protein
VFDAVEKQRYINAMFINAINTEYSFGESIILEPKKKNMKIYKQITPIIILALDKNK